MTTDKPAELATAPEVGDIEKFFDRAVEKAKAAFGPKYISVELKCTAPSMSKGVKQWTVYVDGGAHQSGATLAEAMERQTYAMSPCGVAKKLRQEAAEKIAFAEQLESQAKASHEPA